MGTCYELRWIRCDKDEKKKMERHGEKTEKNPIPRLPVVHTHVRAPKLITERRKKINKCHIQRHTDISLANRKQQTIVWFSNSRSYLTVYIANNRPALFVIFSRSLKANQPRVCHLWNAQSRWPSPPHPMPYCRYPLGERKKTQIGYVGYD